MMDKKSKKVEMESHVLVEGHALVPKHIKLTDKEKDELFKKYDISFNKLPKMMVSDPAISDLKPRVGDVIMIYRNEPMRDENDNSSGKSIFYRGVIHD
jgi:DNA-directed RNA polymerase subunit H